MKTELFTNKVLNLDYSATTLDSGLTVYICERPDFNSVYAAYGTKYGSIDSSFTVNGEEITVPDGIAHFLEHKLFESEDGDAFSKYAETGAYANAFTSFDRTCYIFSCSELFEKNLDILLDFVQNPYFTAETVKKEQGIIGQEIKMYDDSPNWSVLFGMLEAMYYNNPVKIDIAGTTDSIAKIDDTILYKCYNTFYNPKNMFVCIAGNVNSADVLERIDKKVKKSADIMLERAKFDEPQGVIKNYTEKSLEVALPLFCYGFKQDVSAGDPTFKQMIAMNAFIKLLSDNSSPLYKRLIEKKLINDEFDAEYFSGRSFASVIFEGESANPKEVAEQIDLEIESIKKNGIDDKLFLAVKRDMYGQAVKRYNSVNSIAMMLTDCAVFGYDYSTELEVINSLEKSDLIELLPVFNSRNAVLSVINKRD